MPVCGLKLIPVHMSTAAPKSISFTCACACAPLVSKRLALLHELALCCTCYKCHQILSNSSVMRNFRVACLSKAYCSSARAGARLAVHGDQYVLRLYVPVDDAERVQPPQPLQQLPQDRAHDLGVPLLRVQALAHAPQHDLLEASWEGADRALQEQQRSVYLPIDQSHKHAYSTTITTRRQDVIP